MNAPAPTIEARAPNQWLLRAERRLNGGHAVGEVTVTLGSPPDPVNPPHAALAGSRAWHALGETRLAARDAEGAIQCARAGLDELGPDYAPPGVEDDTDLKLEAAEDRIKAGHAADGATVMLRMLHERMQLYAERHASTLVK